MKKWFTLVEMLIVVVIIGILSAALLPRLQGAQASARDTARKADISTLGTAIVSYFNQKGQYPCSWDCVAAMVPASNIEDMLKKQVDLSSLPADPTKWNIVIWFANWLGNTWATSAAWTWQYWYMIVTKNGVDKGWFILMARPETEGGANFVEGMSITGWDISNFEACTCFTQGSAPSDSRDSGWCCTYQTKSQLRYIYIF